MKILDIVLEKIFLNCTNEQFKKIGYDLSKMKNPKVILFNFRRMNLQKKLEIISKLKF